MNIIRNVHLFLAVSILAIPLFGQTVCAGTDADCKAAQDRLSLNEPAPANLILSHPVRLAGTLYDPTGAPIDFDSIVAGAKTIVQIRNTSNGTVLFESPLQTGGRFQFESIPTGSYRLIAIWMKDGSIQRLPLADQPAPINCVETSECRAKIVIHFHGSDNPIDFCPPK